MNNTKMGDHLASTIYLQFDRNIRQIFQLNRNFKKPPVAQ